MTVRQFLAGYAGSALALLALDALWLGTMAERLYRPAIGHLMREGFGFGPAALFYALYIACLGLLAVAPALAEGRASGALWRGAVLGFAAYAAYDFTNQATLRGWPWSLTAIDLAWGTFVTTASALAGYAAASRWGQ